MPSIQVRQSRSRGIEGGSGLEFVSLSRNMAKKKTIRTIPQQRTPVREQPPQQRVRNFAEVNCGYTLQEALNEADRCLLCPDPACVAGCPVNIDIPGFIREISAKNFH